MPKVLVFKDPDGGTCKIASFLDDVVEKVSPALWFGSYAFFQLTELGHYPEDKARAGAMILLKEWICKPYLGYLVELFNTGGNSRETIKE